MRNLPIKLWAILVMAWCMGQILRATCGMLWEHFKAGVRGVWAIK